MYFSSFWKLASPGSRFWHILCLLRSLSAGRMAPWGFIITGWVRQKKQMPSPHIMEETETAGRWYAFSRSFHKSTNPILRMELSWPNHLTALLLTALTLGKHCNMNVEGDVYKHSNQSSPHFVLLPCEGMALRHPRGGGSPPQILNLLGTWSRHDINWSPWHKILLLITQWSLS